MAPQSTNGSSRSDAHGHPAEEVTNTGSIPMIRDKDISQRERELNQDQVRKNLIAEKEDKELSSAIKEAKSAAEKAGVHASGRVLGTRLSELLSEPDADELLSTGKSSFAFDLKGMENASQAGELESYFDQLPGVDMRIVFPTQRAWVTANNNIDPNAVIAVFEEHGVTATLTESSLRRRLAWADVENGRLRRARLRQQRKNRALHISHKLRDKLIREDEALESARKTGFLERQETSRTGRVGTTADVLFTARELITVRRFLVSFIFALPVLLISYYEQFQFNNWQWVLAGLSIPVVFYGGWPFHRATLGGARRKLPALDSASSLAILLAWLWSIIMIVFTEAGDPSFRSNPDWISLAFITRHDKLLFFDVACGITVILLFGRLLSRKARTNYLTVLDNFRPNPASTVTVSMKNRKTGEVVSEDVQIQKLNVGDDVIVEPGEIIPVDGIVVGGSSEITADALGISPFTAKVSSKVYAGCINETKQIKVRVHHVGHRTWLSAVYRWIEQASVHQNKADAIATRTASFLVPIALAVAAADFALWALVTNNLGQAFASSLAVLACTAPVALALSASVALRAGIETAARKGVLIDDAESLRDIEEIDAVIFNRVGSLSEGEMIVESVTAAPGENTELVTRVAGALALESDHPVSRALVRAARESRDKATDDSIPSWLETSHFGFDEYGNYRATVEIPVEDSDGEIVMRNVEAMLWRPRNLSQLTGRLAAAAVSGGTPIVVSWKGKDRGVITLHDHLKDDATVTVDQLENLGLETMMLSRDTYPVARRYGDTVGVSNVLAGIEPGTKAQTVRSVRSHGTNVAMVGDKSVSECFKVANLGILLDAMHDLDGQVILDRPVSDVVLLESKTAPIPWLFKLGRRVNNVIRNNLIFAWAYNAVTIILAILGLLHPMTATILMLVASVVIDVRSRIISGF